MVEALPQIQEIYIVIERKIAESAARGEDYMNLLADTALGSS